MELTKRKVLIIGGGIAGAAAAVNLAENGLQVFLIEKDFQIGGQASLYSCKATDKCQKCSACLVTEKITSAISHPEISVFTSAEITEITGEIEDFQVKIIQHPEYVNMEKCITCGICNEVCPSLPKKAIFPINSDTAILRYAIDEQSCLHLKGENCQLCEQKCPAQAIDFSEEAKEIVLKVDAIIVATGFELFKAEQKGEYGYGKYKNILTSLEIDKQLRSNGYVCLPSNGQRPKKISFIQCVGSRDINIGREYCSRICCVNALRLSKLLIERTPEVEITIFYMDIQPSGKDFDVLYEWSLNESRIKFVRAIPTKVYGYSLSDELQIKYFDPQSNQVIMEDTDLVVLSVGMGQRKEVPLLADLLGIELNEDGFLTDLGLLGLGETSVAGIYLAGACQAPKGISECIADAQKVAGKVLDCLIEEKTNE